MRPRSSFSRSSRSSFRPRSWGGTLPVLVKYLASASGRVGFHTAVPYSVNTLGAVTGCLFTGFFALYVLGVKTTVYTAGAIDILVGALVYFIYGSIKSAPVLRAAPRVESASSRESSRLNLIIIISFAVSGFASLSYETLWTRVFSLVIGSSIYAFTVMLATFLVGIGAGSILFAPVVDRMKKPVAWFAVLEAVIGGVSLVSIFAYRELPFIFFSLKESFSEQFWLFLFRVPLKIRNFFRGRGRAKIKSAAYMRICEHFYLRPNEETGKKSNF